MRRLGLLLVPLMILNCGDGGPTIPPIPTPTPTPEPTPSPVVSCKVEPFYAPCCDDPRTPGDEGFARGWPVAYPTHLEWVAEVSGGCVKGVVFRTGYYKVGVGGDYPVYPLPVEHPDFSYPDWTRLQDAVATANLLGMQGVVDVMDAWALKDRRYNPSGFNCSITKRRPPEFLLEHVRQVVEATRNYGVIYETGNELFLCHPAREWEQAIVDTIRTHNPSAPIGSNARTGAGVDFVSSHGWPPTFDPPLPFGGHWNESDQRPLEEGYVDMIVGLWEHQSIITTIWPGQSSNAQLEAVLRGLPDE